LLTYLKYAKHLRKEKDYSQYFSLCDTIMSICESSSKYKITTKELIKGYIEYAKAQVLQENPNDALFKLSLLCKLIPPSPISNIQLKSLHTKTPENSINLKNVNPLNDDTPENSLVRRVSVLWNDVKEKSIVISRISLNYRESKRQSLYQEIKTSIKNMIPQNTLANKANATEEAKNNGNVEEEKLNYSSESNVVNRICN
jgi:predicted metal-binding transcription factor (methanogenesis marker protein 9)